MEVSILELLAKPGVGNLMLLLASVVGVGGSYLIYIKKRRDRRKNLRIALKNELDSMEDFFEVELEEFDRTTSHKAISTKVYDQNTGELGLLSEDEISEIVSFYSASEVIHEFIDWRQRIKRDIVANPNLKEVPDGVNEEILQGNLESLKGRWEKARDSIDL
jgi:hypothetical protein